MFAPWNLKSGGKNDSWNLTWENVFREAKLLIFLGAIFFFFAKFLASKMVVVWGVFSSLRAFGRLEFSSMVFGCLGEDGWDVDGLEIRPLHRLRWRILPVFLLGFINITGGERRISEASAVSIGFEDVLLPLFIAVFYISTRWWIAGVLKQQQGILWVNLGCNFKQLNFN